MKRFMRFSICAMLVLAMVISVTGCSSDEERARETVDKFMTAYLDFNMEEAKSYCNDTVSAQLGSIFDNNPLINVEETLKTAMGDSFPEETMTEITRICNEMITDIKSKFAYTIGESRLVNESYEFVVNTTIPDNSSVNLTEIGERMQAEYTDKASALLMDMYESGEIRADMTNKEVEAVAMGKISGLFVEVMENMLNEATANMSTVEQTSSIVVSKIGGKWLVTQK